MLRITIHPVEYWDEAKEEFCTFGKEQTLQLEHSLVSLAKWESKWGRPFLSKKKKTYEESIDYIKCMTVTQNVDPEAYRHITDKQIEEIDEYIAAPMTATTFTEDPNSKPSREIITAEIVYYWMVTLGIPFDPCQKWHFNRLMALVKTCSLKNAPAKKMNKKEQARQTRALNEARMKRLNSRG